jgi:hypothetical protein
MHLNARGIEFYVSAVVEKLRELGWVAADGQAARISLE